MAEAAALVSDVFNNTWHPSPEVKLPSQRQLRQLEIVEVNAVDPEDPHEIDDAFYASKISNSKSAVSIVFPRGGLIPYTSEQFEQAFTNGWSRYPDDNEGVFRPMIDDECLVTRGLSLVEGELRPGIELSFQITKKGVTRDRKLRPVAVHTKQKTYEEYGRELTLGDHDNELRVVNLLRRYRGKYERQRLNPGKYRDKIIQGHEYTEAEMFARNVVQEMMVHANKEIGRIVHDEQIPYPHRYTEAVAHKLSEDHDNAGIVSIPESYIAYYSATPQIHHFLKTDKYTHTSSPLRRFMDLLGHQIIEFTFQGGSVNDINVEALDILCKQMNIFIDEQKKRPGTFDL